ncbi:hypothetical protein NUACC26_023390 [Scytonema sp. NUACC26]
MELADFLGLVHPAIAVFFVFPLFGIDRIVGVQFTQF